VHLGGYGAATRTEAHAMNAICSHLDSIEVTELPGEIAGCEDCLAIGSTWMHLRMCETCGHIGCCDQSPNRHARAHSRETSHPIIRSAEPGEDWSYCFVDDVAFVLDS
jgi:uncharacterized UBP type Zn finger protein